MIYSVYQINKLAKTKLNHKQCIAINKHINRFTDTCVVIDVLAGVWVEEIMKVFVEVFAINARADVAIDTVSGDVKIDSVSGVGVELLLDVSVAAMTVL